jgi:hypothetical protein
MFEDTKIVIRAVNRRKTEKEKGQKDSQEMIYKTLHRKLKRSRNTNPFKSWSGTQVFKRRMLVGGGCN